ncbi:unnamed protein product [Rotaria sp. Silwood1]|nr:unnamed protein product [Rotaria sp. Silwood1]CAF3856273.1 unnamed protein product [Rotaria sp. Silwood1]
MDEREKLSSKPFNKKIQSNSSLTDDDDGQEEHSLLIDEYMKSSDCIPFVAEIVIENTEVPSSNSSNNHSDNEEDADQDLTKLVAHGHLRRVLLNLVFDDIANKHHLLYPKSRDYLIITKAVLRSLNIPIDDTNALNEYRESIKQKFKNERKPLQYVNPQVQRNKNKFGKGLGKSIKKSDLVSAERKTEKFMFIGRLDDEQDVLKLNQMLKDEFNKQSFDIEALTYMWKKTFPSRRLLTRNHPIKEILSEYPTYSLPCLIFEEVRMTTDIDIELNVELFLPDLFEKLPDNSMFISDVLPIREIKLLFQYFKDPISYVLTGKDPITPTPCIKMLDDKYELYLDYQLIVHTTSAQEAIAILLGLYNIFEIKFTRHSRGVPLLYGIIFQDQNELTKSLRKILLSWEFIIKNKSIVHQHQSTTTVNNGGMTQSTTSIETNVNDSNEDDPNKNGPNENYSNINHVNQESTINHSFNHNKISVSLEKYYKIFIL